MYEVAKIIESSRGFDIVPSLMFPYPKVEETNVPSILSFAAALIFCSRMIIAVNFFRVISNVGL